MAETKTYNGSCHCGAVKFQVTMALEGAMTCNCSICSRTGWMLSFVAGAKFDLLQGEDHLTDYQFGKKHIHHTFCRTCGVRSFSRGAMPNGDPVVAVNLRCLEGVDLAAVPVKAVDGRSIPIDG